MAVFSTIGNVLASKSQNKAINRSAELSSGNNAANIGLAREIYTGNRQILSPFFERGNVAGNQINALLGLGGSQVQGGPQAQTLPGVQPNALSQFQPAGQAYGLGDTPGYRPQNGIPQASGFAGGIFNAANALNRNEGLYSTQGGPQFNPATAAAPTQSLTPQQAANNAFDIFRNSTGYQFRLGEGLDAVGSAYAGIGGLQSGAALRGINEYGQNFASNEFGNYLNALGAQQATGAGAASSLAGVGQNFAGTVIGANNANTQNQIAAQLGRQNPFANALGGIGGILQGGGGFALGGGFG